MLKLNGNDEKLFTNRFAAYTKSGKEFA